MHNPTAKNDDGVNGQVIFSEARLLDSFAVQGASMGAIDDIEAKDPLNHTSNIPKKLMRKSPKKESEEVKNFHLVQDLNSMSDVDKLQ